MTPAPRTIPLQPYLPSPCSGGTNGTQFSRLMYARPKAMNSSTTTSLIATARLLNRADSLMPTISRMVMTATMNIAGTLRTAPVLVQPSVKRRHTFNPASGGAVWVYGAAVYAAGIVMPTSFRNETTYPDQPT